MQHKKYLQLLLLLTIFQFTLSCKKESIDANGDRITVNRTPGIFHHIHTSGSTPITISYGSVYQVEIKGSSNLVSKYQSTISGEELNLGYEFIRLGKDDLSVHVTLPVFNKLTLSGSAKIQITGAFPEQAKFVSDISGSGQIEVLGSMRAVETRINMSGSGEALFKKLTSQNAFLNISGSGDIENTVTDALTASISGSGNIRYSGNAVVTKSISGSGRVFKE
ncbi:MAG: hypothetical protein EOO88_00105 [Pedobacter sp.]|nr:MAG: hypothetical protein EOO88_00105 [Pedobacter sp.]